MICVALNGQQQAAEYDGNEERVEIKFRELLYVGLEYDEALLPLLNIAMSVAWGKFSGS